ncbi:iron-sulfur protein NUBPL-like protein [Ramicandelaber brevisporus]|nr:iron-sulfur protein NUBPL-like protein [Ramicandelaber brevisporus]
MARGLPKQAPIPGVKRVIAVASGKGGVGKSTVATNVALALSQLGLRTGLLDADIFGPSIPRLMNLRGEPNVVDDDSEYKGMMIPLVNYGVPCISTGFLTGGPDGSNEDAPIVWRGLMVMKAIQQLLFQTAWTKATSPKNAPLDMLVIDMPPGTGDVQLSITQLIKLNGAVIVTTPQDIALIDVRKGTSMFRKVNVPVLGVVKNMSHYICSNCGHEDHIFGGTKEHDGVQKLMKDMDLEMLGQVPLNADICATSDVGKPVVISQQGSIQAEAFMSIARGIMTKLNIQPSSQ